MAWLAVAVTRSDCGGDGATHGRIGAVCGEATVPPEYRAATAKEYCCVQDSPVTVNANGWPLAGTDNGVTVAPAGTPVRV